MTLGEWLASGMLLFGVSVMLLGTWGLIRFGDVYLRMHAATKASTLGSGLLLLGVALAFGDGLLAIKLITLGGLFLLTSPIGAQTLARAAHAAKIETVEEMWLDEMTSDALERSQQAPTPSETYSIFQGD
ncbi:MAG TPA: monovalent cation/H(+) antiporter subunit G [Aggregatilineales bacterium]|nr:monovalent cation/H(+) antiporter subunit G [Anaerolineales bacterium]HRE48690.1 monovalent cation/H(+) antiporter subunit G [Aggregatilineales bacterium]